MRQVQAETVRAQIEAILGAWGMGAEPAALTAEAMVETDLMGIDSHGLSMIMAYEARHREGRLRLNARPRALSDLPAVALLDAGGGLGHPVTARAMDLATDKALRCGIGAVGVFNSHHFGAASWYARRAALRGCCGLVVSTARGIILVPTGANRPMLGTNPLAFAAPVPDRPPFALDMATTTVAANKVKVYEFLGKPLPEGWVSDSGGQAVTDAAEAMRVIFEQPEGGISPLGGTPAMGSHKGYGLAMMVQILAGTLTGGSFTPLHNTSGTPPHDTSGMPPHDTSGTLPHDASGTGNGPPGDNIGHLCVALDPAAFRGAEAFGRDMAALVEALRATPPADPSRPVLVAGDPEEAERTRRLVEGIPVSDALADKVRAVCERSGAPYLLG